MKGRDDSTGSKTTKSRPGADSWPSGIATEWFWETDARHRFSYVSGQTTLSTQLNPSDIIGGKREDFAADRDDPKWVRHMEDLEAHRPFWRFEYSIRLPDGSLAHLSVSGEPRLDRNGGFLGYRGAASDITERRKVERELRQARELFQAVLEHAPFGIVLKDSAGRYLEVSREWQRRFGVTRDQVVGKTPTEILPAELAKAYEARDAVVLKEGNKVVREEKLEQSEGEDEYFLTTRFPTLDRAGNVTGMGLISADITDRKIAELAHAESEQQIRTITDNLPVLIARHDRQWRYRFINREGANWYGMTPSQVVGMAIPDILSSETCDAIRPVIDKVLSGEPASYTGAIDYPDGKTRVVTVNYVPDRGADGAVQGWFAISHDLTEREKAALALQESEEERRTVTDNMPVLMARFDRDWRYRYINREGAAWYGMAPEDVVGRTIQDLFAPETVEDIRPSVEAALKGENAHFAGAMLYPDGKTRSIEISFVPDSAPGGEVRGWFALAQDMTGREKALQALSKSEAQLRAVADNLPVLMVRWGRDMRYRFANKYAEKWYGRPESEIIGRTVPEVFGAKAYETVRPAIEAGLSGRTIQMEELLEYPDGTTRHVDIAYIPDRAADGEILGCFALVQDISERKLAEQALRESEARLQAIMKYAPAGVYLKDIEGRFLLANPQYADWFGHDIQDIVGKTSRELFSSSEASRYVDHDMAVIRERKFISMEDRARHPDGTVRTILINKFPVLDNEGTVIAVGGVDLDITEQKKVEQALRDSESQMLTIADNLPVFIAYLDNDMRYRFVNRTVEEWYRIDRTEIVGKQVRDIVLPETYERLYPRMQEVLSGQRVSFEDTLRYPDGERRDVEMTWIPDLDGSGQARGWFALLQDISMRKRLESELVRRERLATMGQLTGTVAHELRNPLGAVAASITALRRRTGAAGLDVERSLSRAERGIGRCERIITELLDFARAKGLQMESTRFGDWLATVIAEQKIPGGILLATNFCAEDAEIPIDREDMRRAIINILDNACHAVASRHDAGDPPEARIEIGCRLGGGRLVCEIRDNGPGIPADHLGRVMEPLFSTKSFGTGLGLPTVQRIMEEHGGGIEITSEPGKGTLVRLLLPLRVD